MSTAYFNGQSVALTTLGLASLVKEAAPAPVEEPHQTTDQKYIPWLTALGAGAATAGGLYHHMRTPTPTADPYLQNLRERAGDKFTRVLETKTPESGAGRLLERLHLGGGDAPFYIDDYPKDFTPTVPKRVPGAVHYNTGTRDEWIQGDVAAGMLRQDSALSDELLHDKWKEYQYMNKHAPGALAKTENLDDIMVEKQFIPPGTDEEAQQHLAKIQDELRRRYPKGFVMKETKGLQSSGMFPSEKHNFNDLLANYRASGSEKKYLEGRKALEEGTFPGTSIDLYRDLKRSPHYSGRVLEQLLKDPTKVIVQERVPIADSTSKIRGALKGLTGDNMSNEMRVHVENGKVVHDLTFPRFAPLGYVTDHGHIAKANEHVQSIVDKLPKERRHMSFGMDVVPLDDGTYKIIETNPTGNSGFLHGDTSLPGSGIKLRKHYLGNYSKPVAGLAAAGAGTLAAGTAGLGTNYAMNKMQEQPAQPAPVAPA